MRLWSIDPEYLDCKGLVALWRESLLAKKVLEGKTNAYKNHPQLERFKKNPLINNYLLSIWKESQKRFYNFDKNKIGRQSKGEIMINKGQIEYEFKLLKSRLKTRDPKKYRELLSIKNPRPNPIFLLRKGPVEGWEKV